MVAMKDWQYKFFERVSQYSEREVEKLVGYAPHAVLEGRPEPIFQTVFKKVRTRMWVCHVLAKDEINEKGRRLPGTAIHSTNFYRRKSECIRELKKLGVF